jgi:hypothetical protein
MDAMAFMAGIFGVPVRTGEGNISAKRLSEDSC